MCLGIQRLDPKESKGNHEKVGGNFPTKGSMASEGSEKWVHQQIRATLFIACAGPKVPSSAWKSIHQDGWSRTGQAEAVLEDGPSCPSHLVHSQWVFPPNLLPRTEAYDLVLLFVLRKIICSVEDILGPWGELEGSSECAKSVGDHGHTVLSKGTSHPCS